MNSMYDIYLSLPEDRVRWVHRVSGLDSARRVVAGLQSTSMDHYLVYDFRERVVVEVLASPAHNAQLAA